MQTCHCHCRIAHTVSYRQHIIYTVHEFRTKVVLRRRNIDNLILRGVRRHAADDLGRCAPAAFLDDWPPWPEGAARACDSAFIIIRRGIVTM